MKKISTTFLLIFVTLLNLWTPVKAAEQYENMFINGGFEQSLNNGWYVEREADYTRSKNRPHSGEYCLTSVKDYAGERHCQDFILIPGETYELSLWARTEKGHGEARLGVVIRYGNVSDDDWDPEKRISNTVFNNTYTYGEEWTEIKAVFTYDGNNKYGRQQPLDTVQFHIQADPNIWKSPYLISYFDDFKLVRRGNVKGEPKRLPDEFVWAEDPLPAEKERSKKDFCDINDSWAKTTINILSDDGIINGTSDTTYDPERQVTRAEFITLLVNTFNLKRSDKNSGYSDVPRDAWYANAVTLAKNIKLIPGKMVADGKFYPDDALTRGEVCGIISAYISAVGAERKNPDISFTDSDSFGIWGQEIKTAASYGVVNGYPDGSFCAGKNITRAEIAEVVKKLVELKGRRYFYVDPENGNDDNDGTVSRPFKSIYRAKDAVKENNSDMRGNMYVLLKAGMHYMDKTLNMTKDDSGTNGYNIIYTSYGEGKAFLSGGESKKLDWSMYDSSKGIYRAYVGALNTRQMYVNGIRAVRAKSEEKLENYSVDLGREYQAITNSTWLMNLSNIKDVEIVHNGTYYCNYRILIDDIKLEDDIVKIKYNPKIMERSRVESNIYFNLNLWVENAYELLDEEGEWFLSKSEGYLYYKPRLWEDLNTAEITLPTTETLIDGKGTITDNTYEPVHNIQFENIEFGYTTGVRQFDERGGLPLCQDSLLLPRLEGGASDLRQGDIEIISGAVQFENVSYIDFEGCTFKKIGNFALDIIGGIQHTDINNNEFYDISGNALQIGKPSNASMNNPGITDEYLKDTENEGFPYDKRYYKADINITNNYIHDTAVEFLSSGAMAVTNLQYSNISNNEIFRTSYSGMHTGYGFSARPFNMFYNTPIERNYIHKTNLIKYSMNDGGAIYHMSTTYGDPRDTETWEGRNRISYNYCEDQGCSINNIYMDEGASWLEISHNIFNTHRDFWPYGMITTGNKGKNNIVTNNYLRDDTLTVSSQKKEPFTEWYEKTNGVLEDEDIKRPQMDKIGPQYIIPENMEEWPDEAKQIVEESGITDEYIGNYPEEFQDYEIVYNDYGYFTEYMNTIPYLPAVYDVQSGEVFKIDIKAKNRKGTQGYISPDRIFIDNNSPDVVEILSDNSIKALAPGKAELTVQILCGRNKDFVDTYPVEVYVDDEVSFFDSEGQYPVILINGSGGEAKVLTGEKISLDLTLNTKFGRTLKPHEFKITSSNEEFAYVDEDGNLVGKSDGTGELIIDMVWGGNRKERQYKRAFKVVTNEMYADFDKSEIVEVGDDFVNLENWTYVKEGSSDIKEQLEDGVKIASTQVVVYDKEKFNNKILHFKMKINHEGGWPSFALNCGDTSTDLNNEYVLTFYEGSFEWQRFNDGKRRVLWGHGNMWDGTYPVYGGRPGANIEYYKEYDVGIGVFDVPEGVRVVCYLDGLKVFDQIDYITNEKYGIENEEVLSGGGYFGIHSTNMPYNIEIHKPDVKEAISE